MKQKTKSIAKERQAKLFSLYKTKPKAAIIQDYAKTFWGLNHDPFHGQVEIGHTGHSTSIPFGIHTAVGGYSDIGNPGDLLCAALAACLDSTIRIIADRLAVPLTFLEVEVIAELDVRGTLLLDQNVPVGFQKLNCKVNLQTAEGVDPAIKENLLAFAKHSCVNMHTLRNGVSIKTNIVN